MTKKQRIRAAEEAYFKKILGFEYEEVKTTDEYDANQSITKRKTETVRKYSPPDSAALLSYLKTNAPDKWDTVRDTDSESEFGVVLLPEVGSAEAEVKSE